MFNQLHYCVSTMASRRVLQPKNSNLSTKSWSKSCEDLDKIYEDGPACAICGDVALKSHFGVLSCEACGSFFRRYARTEDPFVCFSGGDCIVTKRTRNKCKHCRLEKCISKGMMKEAVKDTSRPAVREFQRQAPLPAQPMMVAPIRYILTGPTATPVPVMPYNGQMHQFGVYHDGMIPNTQYVPVNAPQYVPQVAPTEHGRLPQVLTNGNIPLSNPHIARNGSSPTELDQQQRRLEEERSPTPPSVSGPNSPSGTGSTPYMYPAPLSPTSSAASDGKKPSIAQSTEPVTSLGASAFPLNSSSNHENKPPRGDNPSTVSGPDVPLPLLDLDYLIQKHDEALQFSTPSVPSGDGVSLDVITKGGTKSILAFVTWLKNVKGFTILPRLVRMTIFKHCWMDQCLLNVIYRTFIQGSKEDRIVTSAGFEVNAGDVKHSLLAYTFGRIAKEIIPIYRDLELDYKELICLRLLLLFDPEIPNLDLGAKDTVRNTQEQVLLVLEDHCNSKMPTNMQRFSKLLLSLSLSKGVTQEAIQELEIRKALQSAKIDNDMFANLEI